MKTFSEFLIEARGRDFKPKPFKIGKITFKPVDRHLYTMTAMDHKYVSTDGAWSIDPTGYKIGAGAQALNMTKSGTASKALSWSLWDAARGNYIYTYASLPKAKKGLADTLKMRSK